MNVRKLMLATAAVAALGGGAFLSDTAMAAPISPSSVLGVAHSTSQVEHVGVIRRILAPKRHHHDRRRECR
jgi:hypothetical protein